MPSPFTTSGELAADPELAAAALVARAALGDCSAIRELEHERKPRADRRYDPKPLPGARSVYVCGSCHHVIRGPEALCRSCGAENTVCASGRGNTIR